MHKLEKKIIATFICLTFILLAVTSSSAITVKQQDLENEEPVKETTFFTETVTFYRHGPDGSVKSVKLNLELEGKQDIGDAMIAKCDELLENDEEIQNLLKGMNLSVFCRVKSKGIGFHYKTMLLEKICLRFLLWKLELPRVATWLAKPLIFCRYKEDSNAKTEFKPLIGSGKDKEMEGEHFVVVNSFIGYTTWVGRISITPLNIIPKAFSGYARFAFCKEL